MLSLHAVKCVIEWRKQLIYNYLLTTQISGGPIVNGVNGGQERNNMNKFKNIPFIWEGENYLLKMKSDTQFLAFSSYSKYFNFTPKSDPFLVQSSLKHPNGSSSSAQTVAVGGGAQGLKNLRKQAVSGAPPVVAQRQKMVVPLPNSLLKMIKQCEVYLMEEAVNDQILKGGGKSAPIYEGGADSGLNEYHT